MKRSSCYRDVNAISETHDCAMKRAPSGGAFASELICIYINKSASSGVDAETRSFQGNLE